MPMASTGLTPASLSALNRPMRVSRWIVAAATVVLALSAPLGAGLHEHVLDPQSTKHADCDVCHLRHLSGISSGGAPAQAALALVARNVECAPADAESSALLGLRPTRGPPA